MNTIKKILPYIAVLLVCTSAFMFIKISDANKDLAENAVLIEKEQNDVAQTEPTALNLSFQNEDEKHSDIEIEVIDFLKSFRTDIVVDDMHILSTFEDWTTVKFEGVHRQLSANAHGEEFKYLYGVIIEGTSAKYSRVTSSCDTSYMFYEMPVSQYSLFPENCKYDYGIEQSILTISGVTEKTTPTGIAAILCKTYGYHFVQYHLDIEGNEDDKETEYFRLRASNDERIRCKITDNQDYLDCYNWYLREIAAEDYAYLLGSNNANGIKKYDSNSNTYVAKKDEDTTFLGGKWLRFYVPQSNLAIPLANEVDGLAELFYSFVEEDIPEYTQLSDEKETNLHMMKNRDSFHVFEWDEPYKDAIYSLYVYDENENLITRLYRYPNIDENRAQMLKPDKNFYGWYSTIDSGEKMTVYLIITFPDNTTVVADSLEFIY